MKNLILKSNLNLALLALIAVGLPGCSLNCDDCNNSRNDRLKVKASKQKSSSRTSITVDTILEEDTLAISATTIAVSEACAMIDDGLQLLEVNNSDLPAEVETLDSVALHSLQRSLRAIKKNDPFCYNYVTGIKISLGLNDRNDKQDSIKLLYQPVYMCRNNSDNIYTVSYMSPIYFVYKSGLFIPASQFEIDGIERYRTRIHFNSPLPRNFRDMADSTGDTKAVYYTFQELDSVMMRNHVDRVKIWNFAIRLKIGLIKYTKHSLMLSPISIGCYEDNFKSAQPKSFVAFDFVGKFADRSHLCPPSCEALYYKRIGNAD